MLKSRNSKLPLRQRSTTAFASCLTIRTWQPTSPPPSVHPTPTAARSCAAHGSPRPAPYPVDSYNKHDAAMARIPNGLDKRNDGTGQPCDGPIGTMSPILKDYACQAQEISGHY